MTKGGAICTYTIPCVADQAVSAQGVCCVPSSPQVATQLFTCCVLRIGMILNDAEGVGKAAVAGCYDLSVC